MAGTVGGRTVGLAKGVTLVSVRVLSCTGAGTLAGVIAGVDWVTQDNLANARPSVANMSLGGGLSQPLNDAVTNSIAANVHYSVAAGGSQRRRLQLLAGQHPAGDHGRRDRHRGQPRPVLQLRAVPGSVRARSGDHLGVGRRGRRIRDDQRSSPATAHSTGAAALWRQRFPANTADQVATALTDNATPGVVANPGAGSPNLLLHMGMIPM